MNSKKSETICPLPWTHYFINEKGISYPCCISTEFPLPNLTEKNEPFKINSEDDLLKAWNSDYMKNIRLQMLNGERPAPCSKCYKLEDLGIASHREKMIIRHKDMMPKIEARTEADGTISFDLTSLDFRLGNLCNLKCRMCSPVSSQRLISDWQRLYSFSDDQMAHFRNQNWPDEIGIWDLILKHSDQIEYLHFAGGEPFLIESHFDFLRRLVESGAAANISVSYNTNMTVLPDEVLSLWKNFKAIDLAISLDGTDRVNHYIRYPSNWENIQKNIRIVHDNKDELNVRMIFNITVQVYNIFDLPKLIDFVIAEYPRSNFPLLSPLFGPELLSIQILPSALKAELTKMWSDYLLKNTEKWIAYSKRPGQTQEFVENIWAILKLMNERDKTPLIPAFLRRTRIIDQSRNHNLFDFVPELSSLKHLYNHADYFIPPPDPAP